MKYPIFFFAFVILLSSCSHDNPANPSNNLSGQINTITYSGNLSSGPVNAREEYHYNADGTVDYKLFRDLYSGNIIYKSAYTYAANLVALTAYDSLNVPYDEIKFYTRSNGLVDSTIEITIPSPDSIIVNRILYDANNTPTEIQSFAYAPGTAPTYQPQRSFYTYSNGNLTRINAPANITSFSYYDTVSNLTPHTYGLAYSLIQSAKLPNITMMAPASNPSAAVMIGKDTYTLDNNGKVVSQNHHFYSNGVDQGFYLQSVYTYY